VDLAACSQSNTSPTLVVTEAGCRRHIAGSLNNQKKPQQVVHIAEVLNSREEFFMYSESAHLYDAIYLSQGKDYTAEARRIHEFAQQNQKSQGNSLLDVACGTGLHSGYLSEFYQVEGVDLDESMLATAREKHPGIPFQSGDMRDFSLGRQFDVITCLFSAIGYMKDIGQLHQAIGNMGNHLKPGGVMFVEPWFTPETWHPGSVHTTFVDQPDLKIVRMNLSERKGNLSFFTFHFLVGTPKGVEHFSEYHELALFTHDEYLDSFRANNLDVFYDQAGLYGRGLYIGQREL
jgi:SAM-dependent methyltransferase